MKTKPILFNTEMVQAILENRKTQTRRIKGLQKVNESPSEYSFNSFSIDFTTATFKKNNKKLQGVSVPYQIGDVLWVRETWNNWPTKTSPFVYKASNFINEGHDWKPSIHMPKEAARIFLKVKNIRAERLKDISENDAIAEGVDKKGEMYYDYFGEVPKAGRDFFYTNETAKLSFMGLWCKIKGVNYWRDNPWVWVIEFERVEKPLSF